MLPSVRLSHYCAMTKRSLYCWPSFSVTCKAVSPAICMQDASEHMKHAETKEDGYSIIQTMLATLGTYSSPSRRKEITIVSHAERPLHRSLHWP